MECFNPKKLLHKNVAYLKKQQGGREFAWKELKLLLRAVFRRDMEVENKKTLSIHSFNILFLLKNLALHSLTNLLMLGQGSMTMALRWYIQVDLFPTVQYILCSVLVLLKGLETLEACVS